MDILTTIILALISGGLGAGIAGRINMAIARKEREHRIKIVGIENKRLDNKDISKLVADIKVSINNVERFSYAAVQKKISYWKWFYAKSLYRIDQANDKIKIATLGENNPLAIPIQEAISGRTITIQNMDTDVNKTLGEESLAVTAFRDASNTLIHQMTQLSILSSSNLSKEEDAIIEFQDFNFINLDDLQLSISKLKTINDINDPSKNGLNDTKTMLGKEIDRLLNPVLRKIRNTSFTIK